MPTPTAAVAALAPAEDSTAMAAAGRGGATLKDLCPEDKKKVAKLIKQARRRRRRQADGRPTAGARCAAHLGPA